MYPPVTTSRRERGPLTARRFYGILVSMLAPALVSGVYVKAFGYLRCSCTRRFWSVSEGQPMPHSSGSPTARLLNTGVGVQSARSHTQCGPRGRRVDRDRLPGGQQPRRDHGRDSPRCVHCHRRTRLPAERRDLQVCIGQNPIGGHDCPQLLPAVNHSARSRLASLAKPRRCYLSPS